MTANGRFLIFFQMMKSKRMPRSSVPEHHRPERAQSVWLRLSLVALSVLTLASCKIRIIVPEGGHVYTQSGAYQCDGGQTCNIDVIDFFFDETFIANPYRGYAFRFWKQGTGRFCGKSPNPCRLLTTIFTGDWVPAVLPWLESSDIVFYLQPVFASGDDIIRANGKDWRQLSLFADLSWDEINAVCPVNRAGQCSGTLNGHDMKGWTWASASDVSALFDFYGFDPPSSDEYSIRVIQDAAIDAWLADGWLYTSEESDWASSAVAGWAGLTTESYDDTALARYGTYGSVAICFSAVDLPTCSRWDDGSRVIRTGTANATVGNDKDELPSKSSYVGAWFYRNAL